MGEHSALEHGEAVCGLKSRDPGTSPQGVSPGSVWPWVGHFPSLGPGSSSLKWEAMVHTHGTGGG